MVALAAGREPAARSRRELDALYRTHAHSVFRRAKRILGSAAEAEEIVQEIFERLTLDPSVVPSSWTSFFYTMTTNRCVNRIRDEKNRARLLRENAGVDMDTHSRSAACSDALVALRELLTRLPDDLARVAIHYYGDEMTQDEIAELLSCSRRHVGDLVARLHEAVRRIEAAVEPEIERCCR